MSYISEKEVDFIYTVLLFGGLIFLVLFSFYAIKSGNDEFCGNSVTSNEASISSLLVSNSNNYSFSFNIKDNDYHQVISQIVCFDTVVKTSDYLKLVIGVNGYDKVFYEYNSTGLKCYDLSNVSQNGYFTFNCVNCDGNNNVSLKKSSADYLTLVNNVPVKNSSVYYQTITVEHCKEFVKSLVKYYFIFLSLIGLTFLLVVGFNWFKQEMFEGW